MLDIDWILTDTIRARADGDSILVTNQDSTKHVVLVMRDGLLTFNGEYIETEAFMAYVGLMDQVDDSPNCDVIFIEDFEMIDL